jgi:hypothetical protein
MPPSPEGSAVGGACADASCEGGGEEPKEGSRTERRERLLVTPPKAALDVAGRLGSGNGAKLTPLATTLRRRRWRWRWCRRRWCRRRWRWRRLRWRRLPHEQHRVGVCHKEASAWLWRRTERACLKRSRKRSPRTAAARDYFCQCSAPARGAGHEVEGEGECKESEAAKGGGGRGGSSAAATRKTRPKLGLYPWSNLPALTTQAALWLWRSSSWRGPGAWQGWVQFKGRAVVRYNH